MEATNPHESPGPARAPLSRERVLTAAVAIADTDGIDALTMRAVAADLGVEAMSLYHHVPNKAHLLDGMVEAVIGAIDRAVENHGDLGSLDWRDEVRTRCVLARSVMLRHPWAPPLVVSRTTVPFAVVRYYEAILAAFVRGGLGYHLGHRGLHALGSMVLGFVQEPFSPSASGDGASEDELEQMAAALPHLAAMMAAEVHAADDPSLGWCDSDAEFAFTLELLLDGLARAR